MYLQPIAPLVLSSPSMPQPTGAYALAPSGWGGMAGRAKVYVIAEEAGPVIWCLSS